MDELHVPACTRYSALKNYYRQGIKLLFRIFRELTNFTRPLYKEFVNTAKKTLVCFLRSDMVRLLDSTPETFNEWNKPELDRSLKTVWNHFVRDVFGTLSSKSFAAIATWRYSKTRQTTYYGTLLRLACKQYWFSFCIVIVVIQCPTLLRYYGLLVLNIYFGLCSKICDTVYYATTAYLYLIFTSQFGLYSKTCDTLYCVTTLLQPSCKEYLDFCVFMVIVVIQITTLLR